MLSRPMAALINTKPHYGPGGKQANLGTDRPGHAMSFLTVPISFGAPF